MAQSPGRIPLPSTPMLIPIDQWAPPQTPPSPQPLALIEFDQAIGSQVTDDPLAFHGPGLHPHAILFGPSLPPLYNMHTGFMTPAQSPINDPLFFDPRAAGFWQHPPPSGITMGLGLMFPPYGQEMDYETHPAFYTPRLQPYPMGGPPEIHYQGFPPRPSPFAQIPLYHPPPPLIFQHAQPQVLTRNRPLPAARKRHQHPNRSRLIDIGPPRVNSPLLDAFRNNSTSITTINDIKAHIVEFATDQFGSRFLQTRIDSASVDERQMAVDEVIPNAYQLMTDVFGNYVVQRLFEYGSPTQKAALVGAMKGHVLGLSKQSYGCRVVQKALEHVPADLQAAIIAELQGHVVDCVKSSEANHVIQRMLERIDPAKLGFVVEALTAQLFQLSTHPYGCRVLQRAFEHLKSEQLQPMITQLNKHAQQLMKDPFGNYVVQNLIKCGTSEDKRLVIQLLKGQFLDLARDKYASNLCEQALRNAEPADRDDLVEEIMYPRLTGPSSVALFMRDKYANYVLQSALRLANDVQKERLVAQIRPALLDMRRMRYSSHRHTASIDKLVTDMSLLSTTASGRKAIATVSIDDFPELPPSAAIVELDLASNSEATTDSEAGDDDSSWKR